MVPKMDYVLSTKAEPAIDYRGQNALSSNPFFLGFSLLASTQKKSKTASMRRQCGTNQKYMKMYGFILFLLSRTIQNFKLGTN